MSKHKVEVCVSNVDLGSGQVVERLQAEFPGVRFKRWGCLGYCHRCIHNPYVLIDDKTFLEAQTADELYELARQALAALGEADA